MTTFLSLPRSAAVRTCALWSSVCAALSATALAAQSAGSDSSRIVETERSTLRLATDGDIALTLGGYLQVDGRVMAGTPAPPPDGLLLRRARLVFDARMPSGWHIRLQPDFGQSRVLVQDAYVGWDNARTTVRIGRFRPAYGVERFQSSSTLLHGERSLVNSLMPSRSFGAQASFRRRALTLVLGGFRTPIGAGQQVVDTDGDDQAVQGSGYDVLTRVAWAQRRGFRYAEMQLALLAGTERGDTDATGLTRLLTVGQQPLVAFRSDGTVAGTVVADGMRHRLSMGGVVGDVRTMLGLEGALFSQRAALADQRRTISSGAVALRAAHVRGGARRASQDVIPTAAHGALDVGLRVGVLGVWGDALDSILTRRSATRAINAGVAVAWIPTTLTRLSIAYDQTRVRGHSGVREHLVLLRVQQGF
jgi:phosphate-selective porin OprO and OprP